jgi:hypothetical protein
MKKRHNLRRSGASVAAARVRAAVARATSAAREQDGR